MVEDRHVTVVGRRKAPTTPEECLRQADLLERELDELNPYPRPRGFVYKARTWSDYRQWRSQQKNPRLW